MMPVVAHTTARFWLRPVANAFGTSLSAIATFGFGVFDIAQSRSMMACSSGASSGVTILPCIAYNAIRSEPKNWNRKNRTGDHDDENR